MALTHLLNIGALIVARLAQQVPQVKAMEVVDADAALDLPCAAGAGPNAWVVFVSPLGGVPEYHGDVVQGIGQDWRVELVGPGGAAAAGPLLSAVVEALQGWKATQGTRPGRLQDLPRPRTRYGRSGWPVVMRFGVVSYGVRT